MNFKPGARRLGVRNDLSTIDSRDPGDAKTIYLAANNLAFIELLKAHFIQGL